MVKGVSSYNPTFGKVPSSAKNKAKEAVPQAGSLLAKAAGTMISPIGIMSGAVAPRPGSLIAAVIVGALEALDLVKKTDCDKIPEPGTKTDDKESDETK